MAVLVEAISVIIRADALLRAFGDFDRFKRIVPNDTLCADNELVRVGFMHPADVEKFVGQLEAKGLQYLEDGQAIDLVVADQQSGFGAPCDWAMCGKISLDGDPSKRIAACMLNGSSLKQVIMPEDWTFENSLSQSFGFVPSGSEGGIDLVSTEDGLETWRSELTDKPLYVGRISQPLQNSAGLSASAPAKRETSGEIPSLTRNQSNTVSSMSSIRMHGPSGYGFVREAEERELRQKQTEMIADYIDFLGQRSSKEEGTTDELPHPKDSLVEAFLNVIANSPIGAEIEHAALSIMTLTNFQEGPLAPSIKTELSRYGVSSVDDLSPDQIDDLFAKLDPQAIGPRVSQKSAEVHKLREEIEKAMAMNRNLLPWYIKLWHRLSGRGAYSPFAQEFVSVRYPR